jgi:hypothetical protein
MFLNVASRKKFYYAANRRDFRTIQYMIDRKFILCATLPSFKNEFMQLITCLHFSGILEILLENKLISMDIIQDAANIIPFYIHVDPHVLNILYTIGVYAETILCIAANHSMDSWIYRFKTTRNLFLAKFMDTSSMEKNCNNIVMSYL